MAGTDTAIVRLSDLVDSQEADCFAVLVRRVKGTTYKNEPYVRCHFRDRRKIVEAPLWADSRFLKQAETWVEGIAYRLRVRASYRPKYGLQVEIQDIRPATQADEADGFDFNDLVEGTARHPDELLGALRDCIDRYLEDPFLKRLVEDILDEHNELFTKMQAATSFHHSYTGGLLEHVWSMTRIAGFVGDHYSKYYGNLNPPLNKGIIVAAAILHDIGKLRELKYNVVEAQYTKEGCLIGHVLMGRDLVREAARRIEGFPEETLLLLEHAILAHHGKREFGAPILPQTIEAFIVSVIDNLDAKVNAAARELMRTEGDGEFTDKVYVLENIRIYRGIPREPGTPPDLGPAAE